MKMYRSLKKTLILFLITITGISADLAAQNINELESHAVTLPNGWRLTPAGKQLRLGDLPLNIALSPSGRLAAITNNGESDQTIQLIDLEKDAVADSIIIEKSWLGLAFSDDSKYLYASGGNDNKIIRYLITNNRLSVNDSIIIGKPWPEKISVTGIALDDSKNRLYAVTKENNSLYVLDTKIKKVISRYPLDGEGYTDRKSVV
jgi:DNA-binding beta-propeller fold protein YncE